MSLEGSSVMTERNLRSRLARGETTVGTMQIIDSVMVSELIGIAGMDFVILDQEHGPLDAETAQMLVVGAQNRDTAAIVRTRSNDPAEIQRALDIGADGVQVPQIETKAEAEAVVDAARFSPQGNRGLSQYVRAGDFRGQERYTEQQNDRVAVIVQVEGERGINNIEDILAVEGIDVVFLGPYDLSQSLGIPGQVTHRAVEDQISDVCGVARGSTTAVGVFADTPDAANKWIDAGVSYVTLGVAVALFTDHLASIREQISIDGE